MEAALVVMAFALPLIGFLPPAFPDGWTTYRDRALLFLSAVLLVYLAFTALPFAIIVLLLALRYRSFEDLYGLVVWSSIIAIWFLVRGMSAKYAILLTVAIVLAGLTQALFTIVDYSNRFVQEWVGISRAKLPPICGSLGNRTYLSAYLAMIAPLVAVKELWWLLLIFLLAVVLCGSRGGLLAFVTGVGISWPLSLIVIGPLGMIALFLMLYFGGNMFHLSSVGDSIHARSVVWKLTISGCLGWPQWLIGNGFGSFYKAGMRWVTNLRTSEGFVHAHNDFLQFYFEYGLVGYIALGLLIYQLSPYIAFSHSLTGSLTAIAMVSLFTFPNHIGPIAMTIVMLIALLSRGVL